MTLRAEFARSGVDAVLARPHAAVQPGPAPAGGDVEGAVQSSTKDLESEVYTVRDLHGDDLLTLRTKLTHARLSMTQTSYRRALELARDSILLTIEECLQGAQAMEWQPPRPEFTLASIEAAVAEQERADQASAEQQEAQQQRAELEPAQQQRAGGGVPREGARA